MSLFQANLLLSIAVSANDRVTAESIIGEYVSNIISTDKISLNDYAITVGSELCGKCNESLCYNHCPKCCSTINRYDSLEEEHTVFICKQCKYIIQDSEVSLQMRLQTRPLPRKSYQESRSRCRKQAVSSTKRKNHYTQWVRLSDRIRKGEISGDEKFFVTENFRDKGTPSAQKYFQEDFGIVGKSMTVKALLDTLHKILPGERYLTITAICWGLMPSDFREQLIAKHETL